MQTLFPEWDIESFVSLQLELIRLDSCCYQVFTLKIPPERGQ